MPTVSFILLIERLNVKNLKGLTGVETEIGGIHEFVSNYF